MMKLCFIGCGAHPVSVYSGALLRLKKEKPELELCACCDIDKEKAENFRRMVGFGEVYTDYGKMLTEIEPDAVIIATPYTVTAQIAVDVLLHGVAAMIEKPPAVTFTECMKIVKASEDSGSPVKVAFNRRYMPLIRSLIEDISTSKTLLQNIDFSMYRYNRSESFFFVTAIHGIDIVSYIAGSRYKNIHFSYQNISRYGENTANIFMQCVFESGMHAQLSFCPVSGMTFERMTIAADYSTYELKLPVWNCSDAPGSLIKFECDKMVWEKSGYQVSDGMQMFETNGFYYEVKSFVDDILSGKKPKSDIISALQAVDIADHIRLRKREYNISN